MSDKDGGPAFPQPPCPNCGVQHEPEHVPGMSLRDYFAAQALPVVITAYVAANGNGCAADHALRNIPALAFKYADAMLAERKKGQP